MNTSAPAAPATAPTVPDVPDISDAVIDPILNSPSNPPSDPRDEHFRKNEAEQGADSTGALESVQTQTPVIDPLSQEDSQGRHQANVAKLDSLQPLVGKPV